MQSQTQFGIGAVVHTTARLFASKAGVFLGLSLIGVVPAWLATAPMAWVGEEDSGLALLALALAQAGLTALGFGWSQASIVYYVVRTLRAESPTIGDTVERTLPKIPQVLAAYLLANLAVGLGLLLLVVPGIVLWLMFWVAAPVAAIEGGVVSALRRSHELTNGHKWPLLGVVALLLLLIFLFVLALVGAIAWVAPSSYVVQLVAPGIAQAVIWAVWGVVSGASYYHLRLAA